MEKRFPSVCREALDLPLTASRRPRPRRAERAILGRFVGELRLDLACAGDGHSDSFDDVERRLGDVLEGSRTKSGVAAR